MFHKLPILFCFLLFPIFLSGNPAHADFVAAKCVGPKSGPVAALRLDRSHACVGYQSTRSGRSTLVGFPFAISGEVIASADGRSVVVLHSYISGHRDFKTKKIYGTGRTGLEENPEVIFFYRDDKLVASYRINEITLGKGIRPSTSHITWLKRAPRQLQGETLPLTLLSGRTISFLLASGLVVDP